MKIATVILLIVSLSGCGERRRSASFSGHKIEVFRADTEPRDGFVARQVKSGAEVFVFPVAEIANEDIAEAEIEVPRDPAMRHAELRLKLTPQGKAKMENLTRAQLGKLIAVAVDGEVRAAPVVRSLIS